MIHTHYDNLQVSRKAGDEVIKGAYKYLSQKWHPDKQPPEQKAQAERRMSLINAAYAVLSDPARRREHDAWIAQQEADEAREAAARQQAQARPEGRAPDTSGAAHPQPAGLSGQARDLCAAYVARGAWPAGLVWGFVSFSIVLGILRGVFSGVERWTDAHPALMLCGMLVWIFSSAQDAVADKKKKLLGSSDDALIIMREQSSKRRAITFVGAVILVTGGAIAFAVVHGRAV